MADPLPLLFVALLMSIALLYVALSALALSVAGLVFEAWRRERRLHAEEVVS